MLRVHLGLCLPVMAATVDAPAWEELTSHVWAGFLPLLSLPVCSPPIKVCDHVCSKSFSQVFRLSAMTKYPRETLQKADECI